MAADTLALFINWQDFKAQLDEAHSIQPDAALLFDAVGEYGRIGQTRAYADWHQPEFANDKASLQKLGAELIRSPYQPDVHIAADVMRFCYQRAQSSQSGTIILVSGGDALLPLYSILPTMGKQVKLIGLEHAMQRVLEVAPTHALIYDRDIASINRHSMDEGGDGALESNISNASAWVEDLLRQVRSKGMSPSNLQNVMVHLYGFDVASLGISFDDLLQRMEQDGTIVRQTHDDKDVLMLSSAANKPVITSTPQEPQKDGMELLLAMLSKAGRPVALTKALQVLQSRHQVSLSNAEIKKAQQQGLVRLARNKENTWYIAAK